MTYVGKILVIVIMIFAIGFLFLSTTVFMTERNWKQDSDRLKAEVSKLKGQLSQSQAEKADLEKNLAAAKTDKEVSDKGLQAQITKLEGEIATRQNEITESRRQIETAQENLRAAQQNAEAKDRETGLLREQLRVVQNESNAYKIQQTELNDQIQILRRELEQAKGNNKTLREQVLVLQDVLKRNGLEADPAAYAAIRQPPQVDGEITRVDAQNRRFQISLGSDDGLVVGHELYVYRIKPKPEFLGKVRVQLVDNDQAVVTVVGQTPQGKKIQEGDIVSTTIRPRG